MTPDQLPIEEFIEEAGDLLQELEGALLQLETSPGNNQLVDQVFRCVHTIKGGAGMVMQPELADYGHQLESLLEHVRSGSIPCTVKLVSLLLDALDCLNSFVADIRGDGTVNITLRDQTLGQLKAFLPGSEQLATTMPGTVPETQDPQPPSNRKLATRSFLLTLKFDSETLRNGGDPLILLEQLSGIGEIVSIAHTGSLPGIANIDPETLYLWWSLKLVTDQTLEEIEAILMFYRNDHDIHIEPAVAPPAEPEAAESKEMSTSAASLPDQPMESDKPVDSLSDSDTITKKPAETDPPSSGADTGMDETASPAAPQTIRVSVDRLDALQNLVGETVINQSRLRRLGEEIMAADERLGDLVLQFLEDSESSVRALQDQIQQVRMVPVGSVFSPLKRIVRDYAVKTDKNIFLDISGGDTELDKTVTDQLYGPLLHLVRNAMDHGIEMPQTRTVQNKDPVGTISLRASHQEGFVIVEVGDDGKGLDPEVILNTAIDKGLASREDELSEHEIFQLVFRPGFTTTSEVTSVSGRGVGMDTVQRDIQALLGNIEMHSTPGKGTTLQLKLPLTLAIIEGMIVRVGEQIFTLPLLSILEALRPAAEQVKRLKQKGELIDIRGEFVPLVRLHDRLGISTAIKDPSAGLVVVVQHGNRKHGLMVDEIVDQRPVVIKNLEDNFVQIPGLSGATILGDGAISFILDVPSLAA
mgnify:CR=1 FL=1|jgi:two-component system chemotaxis sensor kinase CheA|tara:strand:+ start:2113 stop:4209 length:2097 start_codon:yes stop_codon:yes gene_type:complete